MRDSAGCVNVHFPGNGGSYDSPHTFITCLKPAYHLNDNNKPLNEHFFNKRGLHKPHSSSHEILSKRLYKFELLCGRR